MRIRSNIPFVKAKSLIFALILFIIHEKALSQHPNNNNIWYLYQNFGINFNVDPPKLFLRNNNTENNNQVTTYSDNTGNLVFYANLDSGCTFENKKFLGSTEGNIWNHNTPMISFKRPGANDQFYILFALANKNGAIEKQIFGYHLVERTNLNISVVENLKTIISNDYSGIFNGASITVGWFPEIKSYSVFIPVREEKKLYVFKVDSSGFNANPISFLNYHELNTWETSTALSPNGSTLAGPGLMFARFNSNNATLYDTLDVNNRLKHSVTNHEFSVQDIEYSLSGRYIYTYEVKQNTLPPYNSEMQIVQYDLAEWNSNKVFSSRKIIKSDKNLIPECLRRGPDGKIYYLTFKDGVNYIGCITNPDERSQLLELNDTLFEVKLKEGYPIHSLPSQVVYTKLKFKPFISKPLKLCDKPIKLKLFDAPKDAKILWNTGESVDSIWVVSPGKYIVTIQSIEGIFIDSVIVEKGLNAKVDLGKDTSFCKNFNFTISNNLHNPDQNYKWNTGSSVSTLPVNNPGTYFVDVIEGNFCKGSDTINISVNDVPVSILPSDTTACLESPLVLDVKGDNSWKVNWSNGITGRKTSISDEGIYQVLIDNKGCISYDTITVKSLCYKVFLPNSFTPGDDDLNNRFAPVGTNITAYDLKIFNRWGEMIFHGDLNSGGWDGTLANSLCPTGVYSYLLTYTIRSGDHIKKGTMPGMVNLIR